MSITKKIMDPRPEGPRVHYFLVMDSYEDFLRLKIHLYLDNYFVLVFLKRIRKLWDVEKMFSFPLNIMLLPLVASLERHVDSSM